MKDSLQIRMEAILKKAREGKMPTRNIRTVGSSSLHQIIKTKEQADLFMKKLKDLN
jgi:S-ribosylhomocysteine lyase LuxS involved in autoinducer biosynthesis